MTSIAIMHHQPISKKTRSRISGTQKREICEFAEKNPIYKHHEIANVFMKHYPALKIDRSTVSKILKKSDQYRQLEDNIQAKTTFRHRSVKYPMLELAMNMWIERVTAGEIIISDSLVKEKGRYFAQELGLPEESLTFSNGWVTKFKKRNGLRKTTIHGEAASAPLENLPAERKKLQELLSHYNPEDIYNADETGLFYRLLPNQTDDEPPPPPVTLTEAIDGLKKVIRYQESLETGRGFDEKGLMLLRKKLKEWGYDKENAKRQFSLMSFIQPFV